VNGADFQALDDGFGREAMPQRIASGASQPRRAALEVVKRAFESAASSSSMPTEAAPALGSAKTSREGEIEAGTDAWM
jgi:hypothetical protein